MNKNKWRVQHDALKGAHVYLVLDTYDIILARCGGKKIAEQIVFEHNRMMEYEDTCQVLAQSVGQLSSSLAIPMIS